MIVTLSAGAARLRRVHGETVRFTCPACKGGASLFAVNGGMADQDGCWFCDECTTGGRYDRAQMVPGAVKFKLRLAGQPCKEH